MRAQSTSGIYAIVHVASGRRYVGSAVSIEKRWDYHRSALTLRRHENAYLTAAWHKYGPESFDFTVLEIVMFVESLVEREQHWIDHYRSADRRCGFNIAPRAGSSLGIKLTTEQRTALSARIRGRKHSAETRAKIGRSNIGKHAGNPLIGVKTRSLTPDQAADIKRRLAEGVSATQASRDTGIPLHTIARLASGKTYPDIAPELNTVIRGNRPEWRTGDRSAVAKLTPDDVRAIRARLAIGERLVDIARAFGVTPGTVSHIKQRRSWQWLL